MTTKQKERNEALDKLRELIKPGDTLYTQIKHVSRSGMSRVIQVVKITPHTPDEQRKYNAPVGFYWLGWAIADALGWGYDREREGVRVSGCGMDMGFHLVETLSWVLYGHKEQGYKCLGKDGGCPSNYHTNHRKVDGPEQWDLVHTNGYAIRQRWL